MPTGVGVGFDDPALASLPPGGNIYFPADRTLVGKIPPTPIIEPSGGVSGPGWVQARDLYGAGSITPQAPSPVLLYGQGSSMTMGGEPVAHAAKSSRGHVSEIFNFHGSPAPWILLGILIVAGFLQLSASAKFGKGNP